VRDRAGRPQKERFVKKLNKEAAEHYRVQQYGAGATIDGVELVELRRFSDDVGSLTELGRVSNGAVEGLDDFRLAQINDSLLAPGAIKAFHVHRRQTDLWYVPPEDRVLLVLVDVRDGSPTGKAVVRMVLGDGRSRLVRVPPGVAHGCRNLGAGAARIIYFTDVHFSPDSADTDEGRLPWDFVGPDVWEPTRD
jgi:dTDP-4-dehydrorhamnose 3,5-epimerase